MAHITPDLYIEILKKAAKLPKFYQMEDGKKKQRWEKRIVSGDKAVAYGVTRTMDGKLINAHDKVALVVPVDVYIDHVANMIRDYHAIGIRGVENYIEEVWRLYKFHKAASDNQA